MSGEISDKALLVFGWLFLFLRQCNQSYRIILKVLLLSNGKGSASDLDCGNGWQTVEDSMEATCEIPWLFFVDRCCKGGHFLDNFCGDWVVSYIVDKSIWRYKEKGDPKNCKTAMGCLVNEVTFYEIYHGTMWPLYCKI